MTPSAYPALNARDGGAGVRGIDTEQAAIDAFAARLSHHGCRVGDEQGRAGPAR